MAVIKYRNSEGKMQLINIPLSQIAEMPKPSEQLKNKIFQYIGETTEDKSLVNGYFYKCQQIEDAEEYEWKRINVQPSGGGEGGTSDYNELDNRPKIAGVLLTGDKSLSDLGINNFDGDYEKLTNKPDKFIPEEHTHLMEDITDLKVGNKVSVSAIGESDDEIKYITVDDVEYKIAGGGEGPYLVAGNYEYSEEEKIIGKWTDGKPVYRKVFFKSEAAATSNEMYEDAQIYNVDNLIDTDVHFKYEDNNLFDRFHLLKEGRKTIAPYVNYETNSIFIAWSNTIKLLDIVIVMKYTKTTDEPGSFKPEMISAVEIPFKHKYSTEEKVVGEWIDGKPIYEITINLSEKITIQPNTWSLINELPNDMDFIINGNSINEYGTIWSINVKNTKEIMHFRDSTISVKYLIIQYTKTTD